jgi:F-type H+-transporting ATPase subunit gamma
MASARELRRRIRSVRSTRQITRAQELVATSKLRQAVVAAQASRRYQEGLETLLQRLLASTEATPHHALLAASGQRTLVIALGSDQGLAGAFGGNLAKAAAQVPGKPTYLVLGRRLAAALLRLGQDVHPASEPMPRTLDPTWVQRLAKTVAGEIGSENYGRVELLATRYRSALLQAATLTTLLPVAQPEQGTPGLEVVEPDLTQVLDVLLPQRLAAQLQSAVLESKASEFAARRLAMHAATDNADKLIDKYTLTYNRARQAAITTEIAEIVGGAAALAQ